MNPTLQSGKQSEITQNIKTIVDAMPNQEKEFLTAVDRYIKTMDNGDGEHPNFRRTATEIIESGYWVDCNEAGLIRVCMLRAKGIAATYIQALNNKHLSDWDPNAERIKFSGHVFIKAALAEGIIYIDSTSGEIHDKIPDHFDRGYEGLDSWDIGLKESAQDLIEMFTRRSSELSR